MKETIVTIPINDLFAPKDGCPLCRMERMLEEQYCEFITGDAMMEPSVRVETNQIGFCHRHFSRMTQVGQKLPNALILESHLQEISEKLLPKKPGQKPDKKQLEAIKSELSACYVCNRIERDMHHLVETVFAEWSKGGEFKDLYNAQPFICLKHYQFIMSAAMGKNGVPSKLLGDFHADTAGLTKNYLLDLKKDISHFATMFDYRNRGADWGTSVDSIERSIEFLTGEKPYQYGITIEE
jgi:hypothetical protein